MCCIEPSPEQMPATVPPVGTNGVKGMNVRILAISILALGMAGCGTYGSNYQGRAQQSAGQHSTDCFNCGVVTQVLSADGGQSSEADFTTGSQVGREPPRGSRGLHRLDVQMHNGHKVRWHQDRLDGMREGSQVVMRDGQFQLN